MTTSNKIYDLICRLYKDKKSSNVRPCHLLFYKFRSEALKCGFTDKELRESLNSLFKEKKIKVGKTLNDKYILPIN